VGEVSTTEIGRSTVWPQLGQNRSVDRIPFPQRVQYFKMRGACTLDFYRFVELSQGVRIFILKVRLLRRTLKNNFYSDRSTGPPARVVVRNNRKT